MVTEKWSLNISTHIRTCSGDDLYPSPSFRTHNSSMEGAMELKFASLEMLFPLESLFGKVKIFRFGPKTMDYSPWFDFGRQKKL